MSIRLPNGRKLTFGYRPDPFDVRDFRMTAPALKPLPAQLDNRTLVRQILDQGDEGACTGFALCAAAELLFGVCCPDQPAPDLSERWAYRQARRHDPWKGENYEGSTLRAALDGWLHQGLCEDKYWRFAPYRGGDGPDFDLLAWEKEPVAGAVDNARRYPLSAYQRLSGPLEIKRALIDNHVVLIGASIHSGWLTWGEEKIRFDERASFLGLHAFILVGYDDYDASFLVANSWGTDWGVRGFGRLAYEDLRINVVDAWTAVVPCRCDA